MISGELEKEAKIECFKLTVNTIGIDQRDVELAYVMGAEPREKRIAELETENKQIKNSDTLCKIIGEQKIKITELKAQIERLTKAKEIIKKLSDAYKYVIQFEEYADREIVKEAEQFLNEVEK